MPKQVHTADGQLASGAQSDSSRSPTGQRDSKEINLIAFSLFLNCNCDKICNLSSKSRGHRINELKEKVVKCRSATQTPKPHAFQNIKA